MLNLQGMLRAPAQSWKVTMKATGLNGRRKRGPDFSCTVDGTQQEAVKKARATAEAGGFKNYAITDIREVK